MKLLANVVKISVFKYDKYIDIFSWKTVSSLQKLLTFLQQLKTIKLFENILTTKINEFVINEFVKLTMFWTGPRILKFMWIKWEAPWENGSLGIFIKPSADTVIPGEPLQSINFIPGDKLQDVKNKFKRVNKNKSLSLQYATVFTQSNRTH